MPRWINEEVWDKVPQIVDGEPTSPPASGFGLLKQFFLYGLFAAIIWPISLSFLPLFVVLVFVYGYPPHVPSVEEGRRVIWLALTAKTGGPETPLYQRLWICALVVHRMMWVPLTCMFWYLDEILYGSQMKNVKIINPLFEISSARSGSTQMARYLEHDESLTGPNLLQILFPYLWMWKLWGMTIGRVISKEWVEGKLMGSIPDVVKEKHELSFFGIETYEVFWLGCHLRELSMSLGPDAHGDEYSFASIPTLEYDWNILFPEYVDRLSRKHMIFQNNENGNKRLFIKGHFLGGAEGLRKKYPDADFFTVLRPPHLVCQSMINWIQCFELDPVLGKTPWKFMIKFLVLDQVRYFKEEQEWYLKEDGANKLVVRFPEYVKDLEGTMKYIYQHVMNGKPVPDHIPKEHPPRERKKYQINRSLEAMGVSEEGLREELQDYYNWVENK